MTPLWLKMIEDVPKNRDFALACLDNAAENARKTGYVSPERLQKIKEYTAIIRNDQEELENFFNAFYIFAHGVEDEIFNEPFPAEFGRKCGEKQFLLVLAMSLIPVAEATFRKLGIPVAKLHETYDEIEAWIGNCERNYGVTGLEYMHGFAWIVIRLFTAQVIRFSRLEYNRCKMPDDIVVYCNKKSGEKCVLMNKETDFNAAGLIAAADEKVEFTAKLQKGDDGTVTGFKVLKNGIVEKTPVTLFPDEWELYLTPGDNAIFMHIPEVGPLKIDDVLDSYRMVQEFYREYYPDYQLKVILSHSWLFDPVLPMLMPETSNICRYQQTGHILPRKGPSDAVRRVFGQPAVDNGVESVEWKSSLQKTLGNYIASGGVCRGGGILIFID